MKHPPILSRWLALPLVLALLALVSACGRTVTEAPIDAPTDDEPEVQALADDVLVSASPDRAAAALLDASAVSGEIYLFVNEREVASVRFYLDDPDMEGEPFADERVAPFDFAGSAEDGRASAFDTSELEDGVHSITAVITDSTGKERVSTSTFLVNNGGELTDALWVSDSSDRSGAVLLEGRELSGDAYIFTVAADAQGVDFLLDGKVVRRERYAFFDFAATAGDGSAYAFDMSQLGLGEHTVSARIRRAGNEVKEVEATFTVVEPAAAPTPPQPDPQPTPEPEPEAWQGGDIGSVAVAGSFKRDGDVVTVVAAGADIWSQQDAFHYVYQALEGDGEVTAKVTGLERSDAWAKAGLMIRETLEANSAYLAAFVTPDYGVRQQVRLSAGASSSSLGGSAVKAPYWLKVVRQGEVLGAFESADGQSWKQVGAVKLPLGSKVYAGLAVTSHNAGQTTTASFESVTLSSTVTQSPKLSPEPEPTPAPAPSPDPEPEPEPTPAPEPKPVSHPTANDPIRVSSNGRFLESTSGKPFFMVADTMWGLISLSRSEVDSYFKTRHEQGFNTILGPVVWGSGYRSPDGTDMSSPKMENGPYYEHLDYIVQKAKQYDLRLGLVMQWGDGRIANYKSAQNAYDYAKWIGSRYKSEPHLFWIVAGEYNLGLEYLDYYDKIGQGLKAAVGSRQLVTIHPAGGEGYSEQSSSTRFHGKSWLDFNAIQTWTYDTSTFKRTLDDWAKSPAKPTLVSETKYESSSVDAFRMRRNAYWSAFAGSLGFGYGHELIWKGNRQDNGPWAPYLSAAGALDMGNLRKLVESRMYTPQGEAIFANHQPDQALIRKVDGGSNPEGSDSARGRVAGMSDRGGAYFMVYVPTNGSSRTVEVDLGKIRGGSARAWWFNPDSGAASEIGSFEASGTRSFTTPGSGRDWVLVVDDASLGWGAPGK